MNDEILTDFFDNTGTTMSFALPVLLKKEIPPGISTTIPHSSFLIPNSYPFLIPNMKGAIKDG